MPGRCLAGSAAFFRYCLHLPREALCCFWGLVPKFTRAGERKERDIRAITGSECRAASDPAAISVRDAMYPAPCRFDSRREGCLTVATPLRVLVVEDSDSDAEL